MTESLSWRQLFHERASEYCNLLTELGDNAKHPKAVAFREETARLASQADSPSSSYRELAKEKRES